MTRLLAALALALPGATALAETPTDELVEEIVELSKQVGDSGQVLGDDKDFAEALQRIASDQPRDKRAPGRPPLAPPQPPVASPFELQAPHHNNLTPLPSPSVMPLRSPAPPRRKPPHILLREAAFQLDRIAHELEMHELFVEADALRDTANKLRHSARPDPIGSESGRGRGHRGS